MNQEKSQTELMDVEIIKGTQQLSADTLPFAREYLVEALEEAIKQNTIVFLETGSEKTLIATMLLRSYADLLRKPSPFFAVFLVPKGVMVQQQSEALMRHTDLKVGKYRGGKGAAYSDAATWKKAVDEHEVLVMTPAILLAALRDSFLKIDMIKVLIFDECHNAIGKHPYARIMMEFYHRELNSKNSNLPRILGMTTSPIKANDYSSELAYRLQIQELENLMHSKIYRCASGETMRQQSLLHTSVPCAPLDDLCGEAFYKVEATGAVVNLSSSLRLLSFYCSKLPSDRHYKPIPRFVIDNDSEICTLHLPKGSPIKTIVVQGNPGKLKQLACLEACKKLHQIGALTDNLVPDIVEEEKEYAQQIGGIESSNSSVEVPPELCDVVTSPISVAANLKRMLVDHCMQNDEIPTVKVLEEITTKYYQENFHLESLETLGDSFLKYAVSQQLFKTYQDYREGFLSIKKEKCISNASLSKLGCDCKIQGFICNDPFDPKAWIIPGDNTGAYTLDKELFSSRRILYSIGRRKIKSKRVADVVEALIGAFLDSGGELAVSSFMEWLGIEVDLTRLLYAVPTQLSPERLVNVKFLELFNHKFTDASLLVEAHAHCSYVVPEIPRCFQGLEFLGIDAVLGYVTTRYIYNEDPGLSPGLLTDLRSASVNNDCYAESEVKAGLHTHIIQDAQELQSQIDTCVQNFEKSSVSTFGWDSEILFPKGLQAEVSSNRQVMTSDMVDAKESDKNLQLLQNKVIELSSIVMSLKDEVGVLRNHCFGPDNGKKRE